MMTGDTDRFADIPDPVRSGSARPVPDATAPSEPSPTRADAISRRRIATAIGAAGVIGVAVVLGLRADLLSFEVLLQIGLWTLAVPVSLAIALRPRAGGFPAGVTSVRIGIVSLLGLFIGLGLIPVDGTRVPLTTETVRLCISFGALAGLPALLCAAVVLRRTFLNAPVLRGAFVGAVCGLAGAISIHSHCPIVSSSHVLLAHGLPILIFGGLGAIFGASRGRV